jgi:hypothetical protein
MFDQPEPVRAALSQQHQSFRKIKGDQVRWTKMGKTKSSCDECFALQHERKGAGWPRNLASMKRTLTRSKVPSVLLLCSMHTELWKEVDAG